MNKKPKYVTFIGWIDSLPFDEEFSFSKAGKAIDISKQSMSMIVLPFCNQGLLSQRKVNASTKFYQKTEIWSKRKAIEANHQRLRKKWLKYKSCEARVQGN
jgi:hypothetical protein